MSYENPPPPEHVNVSRDNPFVEFLRLVAGLAVAVASIAAVLYFGGSRVARLVPFETECALVGDSPPGITLTETGANRGPVAVYLQDVTERLAAAMDLPAGMKLKVHDVNTGVPNAFAGLGGHIAVSRGLYEKMASENALAVVLAHEIAHIRARDPIAGLGGGAALLLALALVRGDAAGLSSAFAGVVQAGYSRRAESEADEAAIAAVRSVYGHAGGGSEAFRALADYQQAHGGEGPSFLSTHPLTEERIERMKTAAEGWDPQRQPLRPIAVPAAAPASG
jgi:Zn-dependent protease with chaperone function